MTSVAFDHSGTYLAVGGGGDKGLGLQVRVVKDWSSTLVSDCLDWVSALFILFLCCRRLPTRTPSK